MRKYSKTKKYLVNNLRRNERRMTTKKAKRAQGYIALAIALVLITTALINWANSSTTISIDNSKNWDARIEAESEQPQEAHMDEAKDGVVVATKDEGGVQSTPSSDVVKMIEEKFGEKAEKAIKIAQCESHMNPQAVGDHKIAYMKDGKEYGKSYGIFQVRHLPGRPEPEQLVDPQFNVEYAYQVYQKQGWDAWRYCSQNS